MGTKRYKCKNKDFDKEKRERIDYQLNDVKKFLLLAHCAEANIGKKPLAN